MKTTATRKPNGHRRRSPRLARVVEVEIAGRGADGKVLVESASTCDISRHGASLTARTPFPRSAPLAIRRSGGKPALARVVSVKSCSQPGLQQLGVGFVEEESYWEHEFPPDWQDKDGPAVEDKKPAEEPAAAHQRIHALDESLERVLRKGETLRAQTETMLREFAQQVEAVRQQSASALAPQLDLLAARKNIAREELADQARAAAEAIRAQEQRAHTSLVRQAAGAEEEIGNLPRKFEAVIQAAAEKSQQALAQEGSKAKEIVAQAAASLEAHRKGVAELEAQAARWREQMGASLNNLRQEAERVTHRSRGEMNGASLASVQEFRKLTPQLVEEASRSFAAVLGEQKGAATRWIAQSLETARASFTELQNASRAALAEHGGQALEQFKTSLQERSREAKEAGSAEAAALETRLQRLRTSLRELADLSERVISGTQEKLSATTGQAESQLRETATRHLRELGEAAAQAVQRLEQQAESLKAGAAEATRQLDEQSRDVQQMRLALDRSAEQRRKELDALSGSLTSRYDQRKEALDRLLETLENGRAALRANLDSLRTCTEENQAQLGRFAAGQEASLKSRTLELEQKLQAATTALESALQERAAAALESFRNAFSTGLEQAAAQAQQRFGQALAAELEKAAPRVSELASTVDRHAEQRSKELGVSAAAHVHRLHQARQELEASVQGGVEHLAQRATDAEHSVQQAAQAAVGAVADGQAKAATSGGEILASIQQAHSSLTREGTEVENQARQRRQGLEAQFAGFSSALEDKRTSLISFYSSVDKTKAELALSVATAERRVEDARTAIDEAQHEIQAVLDRRAEALTTRLHQKLKELLNAGQQEIGAVGEAAQEVFQARIHSSLDRTLEQAEKRLEQAGGSRMAGLERSVETLRLDYERRLQHLAQQYEEACQKQTRMLTDAVADAAVPLRDQTQQLSRTAIERVREAHEMLLRETPAQVAQAEVAFRQSLERILEQAREEASATLATLCSQWVARSELELRRRLYEAQQKPIPPGKAEAESA